LNRKVYYVSYGIKGGYQKRGNIVGVVEDFNFRSLHHAVQPMVMDIQPARYHCIAVKLSTHDMASTLRDLETKWHTVLPTIPFQFIFLDQTYREQYRSELNTSELTNVLSVISLFIALLGLVGLASFMLEQRKKEIGVRKVVGASAFSIVRLFSWEYLKIFLMGFVLAVPVSFYFFNEWLRQFAYRIEVPVLSVMLTLVVIVLIAWASVAYQTIKASLVNPTKVLRQD
jgi:putative ABC transport system permease protein